tara:strand:- start:68 stop:364 length:297 start_codon:yes stop_codon:yes gene_type:complete
MLTSFPKVFSLGTLVKGRVEKFYRYGVSNNAWSMRYSYNFNSNNYSQKTTRITNGIKSKKYNNGDNIDVYLLPESPRISAPAVNSLIEKFKLNLIESS